MGSAGSADGNPTVPYVSEGDRHDLAAGDDSLDHLELSQPARDRIEAAELSAQSILEGFQQDGNSLAALAYEMGVSLRNSTSHQEIPFSKLPTQRVFRVESWRLIFYSASPPWSIGECSRQMSKSSLGGPTNGYRLELGASTVPSQRQNYRELQTGLAGMGASRAGSV